MAEGTKTISAPSTRSKPFRGDPLRSAGVQPGRASTLEVSGMRQTAFSPPGKTETRAPPRSPATNVHFKYKMNLAFSCRLCTAPIFILFFLIPLFACVCLITFKVVGIVFKNRHDLVSRGSRDGMWEVGNPIRRMHFC